MKFKLAMAGLALTLALPAMAVDNVKMMIGANPGGGYDQTGRGIGAAMIAAGAVKTVEYTNKGGAGGSIGLAQFVNSEKGNANGLVVTGAVMVGAIVTNKPDITLKDATPIARLFGEYNVLVTTSASGIKNVKDLVAAMKANPGAVSFGGGSKGSVDHIMAGLIAKESGVDVAKLNYIPFAGGGEASAAILGGKVTVGIAGYAEFAQFIKSGKMIALAVSAPAKMEGIASFKEQGVNVEIANWRGVYGAPGITPAQRKALIDAVVAGTKHASWQEKIKSNDWVDLLLTGDDFAKFVDSEHVRLGGALRELGIAK